MKYNYLLVYLIVSYKLLNYVNENLMNTFVISTMNLTVPVVTGCIDYPLYF